ncbi:hypothetical protein OAG1_42170 [Agarivorans sp. OAG1]|uniref:hypothetical protein n=1 Tax=Agarivorans sp. OAG1 TaxID=3082387 RepID=UPI002B283CBB|nr:hypothetical protein OAG1_42170 [Agarivorans sp. OAG1]
MKTLKLAALITTALISTGSFAAEKVNFANPYSLYSGLSIGYGDNDASFSAQFDAKISDNWSMLGIYKGDDNFGDYAFSLSSINSNGFGVTLAYDFDKHHKGELVKAEEAEIRVHYAKGSDQGFMFLPELAIGGYKQANASGKGNYGSVTANLIYNASNGVWLNVAPEYKYSFSDIELNDGGHRGFSDWDVTASIGYTFKDKHSISYSYQYDANDNLSTITYSYGF